MKTATLARMVQTIEGDSPVFRCQYLNSILGIFKFHTSSFAKYEWRFHLEYVATRLESGAVNGVVTEFSGCVTLLAATDKEFRYPCDDKEKYGYRCNCFDSFPIGKNYLSPPDVLKSLELAPREVEGLIERSLMSGVDGLDFSVFKSGGSSYNRKQGAALFSINALSKKGYGTSQKQIALFLDEKINQLVMTAR